MGRLVCILLLGGTILLLAATPCFATKFADPVRYNVFSPNQAYFLDVNPDTSVHSVYAANAPDKPLWSFSLAVGRFPFLLSDDGEVVATIAWRFVEPEDVPTTVGVTFWNKDGILKTYPLEDLCSDPVVGGFPIGGSWLIWYKDVTQDGEHLTLTTTRGVIYTFRFADGELVQTRSSWVQALLDNPTPVLWLALLPVLLVLLGFLWFRRSRLAAKPVNQVGTSSWQGKDAASPLPGDQTTSAPPATAPEAFRPGS